MRLYRNFLFLLFILLMCSSALASVTLSKAHNARGFAHFLYRDSGKYYFNAEMIIGNIQTPSIDIVFRVYYIDSKGSNRNTIFRVINSDLTWEWEWDIREDIRVYWVEVEKLVMTDQVWKVWISIDRTKKKPQSRKPDSHYSEKEYIEEQAISMTELIAIDIKQQYTDKDVFVPLTVNEERNILGNKIKKLSGDDGEGKETSCIYLTAEQKISMIKSESRESLANFYRKYASGGVITMLIIRKDYNYAKADRFSVTVLDIEGNEIYSRESCKKINIGPFHDAVFNEFHKNLEYIQSSFKPTLSEDGESCTSTIHVWLPEVFSTRETTIKRIDGKFTQVYGKESKFQIIINDKAYDEEYKFEIRL